MAIEDMDENIDAKIQLDQEIKFIGLMGNVIVTRATRLSLSYKDEKPQFSLLFEVGKDTYDRILAEDSFGLFPHIRGVGADYEFVETQPIELSVVLRHSIGDALIAGGEDIEDVLAYLLQAVPDVGIPVKSSESWLAIEVKQLVELPDDLAVNGSLKSGYRTAWMDILAQQEINLTGTPIDTEISIVSIDEIVAGFLSEEKWSFERLSESLFRLQIQGEHGDWVTLVQTDEVESRCIVYSVYPDLVPEAQRLELAAFLIQENYELPIGNFEMDLEDGELRFRTSLDVDSNGLTTSAFEQLFSVNVAIMDSYFALIQEQIGVGRNENE